MALPTLITADDLANHLGVEFEDDEAAQVASFLVNASTLVRNETNATYLNEDGTELEFEDALTEDKVTTVVKQVAARAWTNPDGLVQESSGPFGQSFGREAPKVFYLTDEERALLGKSNNLGVWALTTTRGDLETARGPRDTDVTYLDTVYADGTPNGEPIPWDMT